MIDDEIMWELITFAAREPFWLMMGYPKSFYEPSDEIMRKVREYDEANGIPPRRR